MIAVRHALRGEVDVEAEVDAEERDRHLEIADPLERLGLEVLGTDQLEVGALQVGVRDHDRRVDLRRRAVLPSRDHADGSALLDANVPDRALRPDLAAVGADRLDQSTRQHLPAAFRVVRAAQEVIGQPRGHRDRRVGGTHRVAALLAEQNRRSLRRELVLGEEVGHRAQTLLKEGRGLRQDVGHGDLAAAERVPGGRHVAHHVENRVERRGLGGERLVQTRPVAVPAERNPKRQVGEVQRRVAVGIHRPEHHALRQAEPVQHGRDHPVAAALADVVDADVELVLATLVLAPEDLAVSARDVVTFEHQRPPAGRAQVRRRGEATQARSDHDRVELLPLTRSRGTHAFLPAHRRKPTHHDAAVGHTTPPTHRSMLSHRTPCMPRARGSEDRGVTRPPGTATARMPSQPQRAPGRMPWTRCETSKQDCVGAASRELQSARERSHSGSPFDGIRRPRGAFASHIEYLRWKPSRSVHEI